MGLILFIRFAKQKFPDGSSKQRDEDDDRIVRCIVLVAEPFGDSNPN